MARDIQPPPYYVEPLPPCKARPRAWYAYGEAHGLHQQAVAHVYRRKADAIAKAREMAAVKPWPHYYIGVSWLWCDMPAHVEIGNRTEITDHRND